MEQDQAGALPGPAAVAAAIDRPTLAIQQLATTLRVPADEVMLIGGMTAEQPPDVERPNLFLFVKVTVQELRDDREVPEMRKRGPEEKAAPDKYLAGGRGTVRPVGSRQKRIRAEIDVRANRVRESVASVAGGS